MVDTRRQRHGMYAVGDVTSVGTSKAGVFNEGQAVIIGRRIIDMIRRWFGRDWKHR